MIKIVYQRKIIFNYGNAEKVCHANKWQIVDRCQTIIANVDFNQRCCIFPIISQRRSKLIIMQLSVFYQLWNKRATFSISHPIRQVSTFERNQLHRLMSNDWYTIQVWSDRSITQSMVAIVVRDDNKPATIFVTTHMN
jgi:hypothetical protein